MGTNSRYTAVWLLLLGLGALPRLTLAGAGIHDSTPPDSATLGSDTPDDTDVPTASRLIRHPRRRPRAQARRGCTADQRAVIERLRDDREYIIDRIDRLEPQLSQLESNERWGAPLAEALQKARRRLNLDSAVDARYSVDLDHDGPLICEKFAHEAAVGLLELETFNLMIWYAKDMIHEHRRGVGSDYQQAVQAAKSTLQRYRKGDRKGPWIERWNFGDEQILEMSRAETFAEAFQDLFPPGKPPAYRDFMGLMQAFARRESRKAVAESRSAGNREREEAEKDPDPKRRVEQKKPRVSSSDTGDEKEELQSASTSSDEEKEKSPGSDANEHRVKGGRMVCDGKSCRFIPDPKPGSTTSLKDALKALPPRTNR